MVERNGKFSEDELRKVCPGEWEDAPKAPPRRLSGLARQKLEMDSFDEQTIKAEECSQQNTNPFEEDEELDINGQEVVLEDRIQAVHVSRKIELESDEAKTNLITNSTPIRNHAPPASWNEPKDEEKIVMTSTLEMETTPLTIEILDDSKTLENDRVMIYEKNSAAKLADESPSPNTSNFSAEINKAIDTLDSAITRSSPACSRQSAESSDTADFKHHQGHFVVVAIDFGTTFSGYAFSFTRDPKSIHMMRKWEGGDPGVINQKTPTTILLDPEGRFHSFGFTARDFFHDLDPDESKKWLYFEKFKMVLHHNADLNEETTLIASNGTELPATKIFSSALQFFKQHALQELSDQAAIKILNEDVRWVITVPAIWKQPAKQFMRQAAYEAGIASPEFPDQLIIALEPEAASVYCRRLRMYQLVPETPKKRPLVTPKKETPEPMNMDLVTDDITIEVDDFSFSKYPVHLEKEEQLERLLRGTRYMVVDCGGGTVDITVHEMQKVEGKLKELHKATGGPYGSVGVDQEFEQLLIAILGKEFIEAFRYRRPAGWVDLMIAFESRKRAASPYKDNPLNVSLPFSLIDFYKKHKGGQVETAVRRYADPNVRWSSQGMLRLMPDAMKKLFQPTLEKIVEVVGDVLNHPDAKGLQYMFLVGGFAESALLQYRIRQEFAHIVKVIIPQGMGLCILKGAVLFGLDPTVVTLRKSRLTYGVGVLNRFVDGKHPKKKRVERDGIAWCTDVFDKFVCVNQSVALGDTVLRSYTPAKVGQKQCIIHIYCSDRENVQFITDKGVKRCGTLCLDFSDTQYQPLPKRREIQARMLFGDTEVKVSALDVTSGKCVRAAIDFLNK
ncbi:heat shock 70 kDa protein 12A-like isoform X2 [Tubulanus polymorphus]